MLEENILKEFINKDIPNPADSQYMAEWRKRMAKARRIILEGVLDHVILNLRGKETFFSMWKALRDLFQNNTDHKKLTLKEKLRKIKMEKGNTILKYLTKFIQCQDELGSVSAIVAEDDMVSLALLGLPKS